MSEEHDENTTDRGSGGASWPMNLLKGASINDTDPLQATHPTVVAVCNVLMFDGPVDYKAWHCPAEHVRTRETMEQCISHLILQRRPSATQEWIEKLPEVSKRLEKNLYFSARSIDEYSDPYTLVTRIQELVKALITTAATLPVPQAGSDQHSASKSLEAGEDVTSEDNESERADGVVRIKSEPLVTPLPTTGTSITHTTDLTTTKTLDLTQAPLYLVPLKEAELVQQQAAAVTAASNGMQQGQPSYSSQVSSQGCSRVFIIKVLISVSEFVKGKSLPSIFTFKRELVMDWLIAAKQACCLPTYLAEEGYYGGPPFVNPDPSTHWSEPHQLYTWWKNNVERRSKFKVLQEDAKFKGLDPRRLQRARWCEAVVALSELIRASSGSSNASRTAQQASAATTSANSASQASALAIAGNPLTNSTAYIQALTASMAQNAANEETTSESSGAGGFYHLPGLPSFAQVHSATTADDRSGIDALMNMSNEMNSFLSAYGSGGGKNGAPPLPLGLQVGANPLERLSESSEKSTSFDPYALQNTPYPSSSAHLSPYMPAQHLYPAGTSASSKSSKTDLPTGLTPGLSAAMQNAGLSLDTTLNPTVTPLLSKYIPPPSNLIIGTHIIPGTNIPYRNYSNTFPVKLFDLVSSEDEAVVGWQGHGTSFQVRDMDQFVNVILPKHFKHNNFTSFQRQLNLYGFRRSASYDKGAYYHPQFQQNQRELAESIRRVLAPTSSERERGDRGGGERGDKSNDSASFATASALAMSYLNSLPPGMSVNMPGLNPGAAAAGGAGIGGGAQSSYTSHELSGGDGAAESLLSISGAGLKTGANTSSTIAGGPTPLPLSSWVAGQGASAPGAAPGANAGAAGTGPGSAYWQNMAANPYLTKAAQNPYTAGQAFPQYTGLGGIGIDGATGAYGLMSQLAMHQQAHQQNKLFKVPPRGYNRNSHQRAGTEGGATTTAPRKTKLSARDRKLLDMSSNFNAEQFLASTVISDRYNLGTHSSQLTEHTHHSHHRRHRAKKGREEEEEDQAPRGRGRPSNSTKRRAKGQSGHSSDEYGDETTYQDGGEDEEVTHHRTHRSHTHKVARLSSGRPSRRSAANNHAVDDDASSASEEPEVTTKSGRRASGSGANSRSSSYRNIPQEVLAKSGLSRHSAITHLTQDAEEDLLDLRNPRRRVYLDFTMLGQLGADSVHIKTEKGEKTEKSEEKDALDYVVGFYRGVLTQGKKDAGLHYQLHGSRVLPEALLKLQNETAAAASPAQSLSSVIAAQNKNNLPRSTRVGEDYQCDIPALTAPPNVSAQQGPSRRSASYVATVPVWRPEAHDEKSVDSFMELVHARKRLIPLPVGQVLVVHLKEEKAYRLCCILDVYFADPTPRDGTDTTTPRTPATPALGKLLENSTVRVFDGYEDFVVPASDCQTFREGEMELALQLLVKHQGQITPTLVQEVDWLLQSGVCSEGSVFAASLPPPTSWTADEVLRFCTAVKRYGDNIKKVWELRFEESGKSIEEVQEFFLRIYPHTQLGGAKRVVSVFSRGELAAAGYPDGEASSDSSEEGEGEEEEGDLESVSGSPSSGSRSSSNSASNSDVDEENEGGGEEEGEGSTSASRGTASEVGSVLNARVHISSTTVTTTTAAAPAAPVAVSSGRITSRSSKNAVATTTTATTSTASTTTALVTVVSGRRSSGAAAAVSIPAPAPVSTPTPVAVNASVEDAEKRRSGRKRGAPAEEPAPAVPPAPVTAPAIPAVVPSHALVPGPAETKRRRR